MAVTSGQVTVGLTPVVIDGVYTNPYRLHVHSMDNTKKLYIGGPDVTTANGLELQGLDTIDLIISPNEQIYIVSDQVGNKVSWLRIDV